MRLLVGMSDIVRRVPHNYIHVNLKTSEGRCNMHNLQSQLQSAQVTHSTHIYAIALTDISLYCLDYYISSCSIIMYHTAHIYCITANVPYWGI
jgi:hypothetical protein